MENKKEKHIKIEKTIDELDIPEVVFETIDKYFPKGDKRRGEALVVNAISLIAGFKQGKLASIQNEIKFLEEINGKILGLATPFTRQLIEERITQLKSQIENEK